MKEQTYKQCDLKSGGCWRTSWIPSELARSGNVLLVGDQRWRVITAYPTKVTMEFLSHVRDAQKDRESTVR